jgi:hypothetical protein
VSKKSEARNKEVGKETQLQVFRKLKKGLLSAERCLAGVVPPDQTNGQKQTF